MPEVPGVLLPAAPWDNTRRRRRPAPACRA